MTKPEKRYHLRPEEVETLVKAARGNRHGQRDACLVFMLARHGLRVSEAIALDWDQVDWQAKEITIARLKNGKRATHPLRGDELRMLRPLWNEAGKPKRGTMFLSERGGGLTRRGVALMVERAGQEAGLDPELCHPHALRHACGYALINAGIDVRTVQDYLGHRAISNTVRYTELDPTKFRDCFR